MYGEDGVCSWAVIIEFVFSDGFVVFSLEQNLLCVFFIVCLSSGYPFNQYITLLILLNGELVTIVLVK